jgi:hypothetical protein
MDPGARSQVLAWPGRRAFGEAKREVMRRILLTPEPRSHRMLVNDFVANASLVDPRQT